MVELEFFFQIKCEKRRIYIQSNNLKQTCRFIHTSNFIKKTKNKQKKTVEMSDYRNVSQDTQKSSISFLHSWFFLFSCQILLFYTIWNALVMSLCSVNWMCFLFNVFVCCFTMYFSLLWKWRVICSGVDWFRGDGRYNPPLCAWVSSSRTILCAKKCCINVLLFFQTNLCLRWILRKVWAWEALLAPSASWSC